MPGDDASRTDGPGRSLGRTILRNTLFVSSGGGAIRLLSFAYTIFYVRTLGEAVYGQYATVLAFCGLFSIFFELGTTQYVERSLAQDRTRLPSLLWLLIVVRLILAGAGLVVLTATALLVRYEPIIVLSIMVQSLTFVLAAVLAPLLAVLASHERYDLWTVAQVIGQVGSIGLGVVVLTLGGGLVGLVMVGLVVMPVQIGYCLVAIRRATIGPLRVSFQVAHVRGFLQASLPFALTSLALTVSFNIDTFLLSLFHPSEVVGWYSAAYRLVPTTVAILGGFLTTITPSLARTYVHDRESVRHWTRTSLKWLAMFGLPAAVGTSLLAGQIVHLLYGPAFAPAAAVLAVISWDIPLRLFNAFAGTVTAAIGLERPAWRTFMSGTVLGLVLYPIAIGTVGMMGAAAVTVLTDALTAVLFYRLLTRHLLPVRMGATLLLIVTAAVGMGAVVWPASQMAWLPVTVVLGVLSFTGCAIGLRLIDPALVPRMAAPLLRGRRLP